MDGPDPKANADLAALLVVAYRDLDSLRAHVAVLQKRADKGDRLADVLHALGCTVSPDSSPSPQGPTSATVSATNGSANPTGPVDTPSTPATAVSTLNLSPQVAQQLRQVVEMYEEKLAHVQGLLEESEARNKESWRQLDEILLSLHSQIHGARAIARPHVDSPAGPANTTLGHHTLGYTYTDSPTSAAFPSTSPGAMGPPAPHGHGVSSSSSSRHVHSGSGGSGSGSRGGSGPLNSTTPGGGAPVAFALPPHPPLPHSASAASASTSLPHSHSGFHQSGTPQPGAGAGPTRRPRTPSMDNLYAIAQPPSKRPRAAAAAGVYDSVRRVSFFLFTSLFDNISFDHSLFLVHDFMLSLS